MCLDLTLIPSLKTKHKFDIITQTKLKSDTIIEIKNNISYYRSKHSVLIQ